MNGIAFLQGVPHAPTAEEDEGDAEELTHVESHAALKIDLLLLEELDEEAEGEDGGEAKAEMEAGAGSGFRGEERGAGLGGEGRGARSKSSLVGVPIDEGSEDEDDEVGDGFVELGGMARCGNSVDEGVAGVEDEAPGEIGGVADDFGVHQVAEADEAGHGGHGDGDIVHDRPGTHLGLPAVEGHGDDESDGSAVGGEAFVAGVLPGAVGHVVEGDEHFEEMGAVGQVVAGLIEEAVAESGADEHADEAVEEEGLELLVFYFLQTVEALDDEVGGEEAEAPEQAVPADAEGADGEGFDGGLPVDEEKAPRSPKGEG